MSNIERNKCVYKVHPQYNLYAASEDAQIIHIVKQTPMKGNKTNNGYMKCMVRKQGHNQKKHITFTDLFRNVLMVLSRMVRLLIISAMIKQIIAYVIYN